MDQRSLEAQSVPAGLAAVIADWIELTRRTAFLLWLAAGLIGGTGVAALAGFQIHPFLAMALVCGMAVLNATQRLDSMLRPPFTVMTLTSRRWPSKLQAACWFPANRGLRATCRSSPC